MSKKIVMYVTARIEIDCEDQSVDADELFQEMDYSFEIPAAGATVVDTELIDYEVKDLCR